MPEDIVLGFDFGMKRIGVAVGNKILSNATPLKRLEAKDGVPDWQAVNALLKKWRPSLLLVGIPLNMDGTEQPITLAAKKFGKKLHVHTTLPVVEVDERLTTVTARQDLFDEGGYKQLAKSDIDSYSAKLITEHWLSSQ